MLCGHKSHTAGNPVYFSSQVCGLGKTCQIPNSALRLSALGRITLLFGGRSCSINLSGRLVVIRVSVKEVMSSCSQWPSHLPSPPPPGPRPNQRLHLHTLGPRRRWSDPSVTLHISNSLCRRCSPSRQLQTYRLQLRRLKKEIDSEWRKEGRGGRVCGPSPSADSRPAVCLSLSRSG